MFIVTCGCGDQPGKTLWPAVVACVQWLVFVAGSGLTPELFPVKQPSQISSWSRIISLGSQKV